MPPRGNQAPAPGLTKEQTRAMNHLIGRPVAARAAEEDTDATRLLALADHVRAKLHPPINPLQASFPKFATTMCFTKDEGAGGKVGLIPDWPYLYEVSDALITCQPVLIEKARRTLISWWVCAFDLWLLAGGQDPRWPALMNSRENRKVIIGAQFKEGEASSQDFLSRLEFMVDQIEARGLRELWPEFPRFMWRADRGTGSNGSIVSAVPQGANKVRGSGITFIHYEELGFVEEARATVMAALQTLRPAGHFCGITTANAASFCADIVNERLRALGWESVGAGIPVAPVVGVATDLEEGRLLRLRKTIDDWFVLTVPWKVVPGYDYQAACKGMGENEIAMELDINWSVSKGKAVYPEFDVEAHVALSPLVYDPALPLHIGFDWLGTPACVISQLNIYGQWLIFPSLSPPESESIGIYEFAERVAEHLQRHYGNPHDLQLSEMEMVFIGDPAGNNPPTKTGATKQETASAFEILFRGSRMYLGEDDRGEPVYEERPGWGWRVISGELRIAKRIEAVRARLTTTLKRGLSATVIDPRAEVVKGGFNGGYSYKKYPDDTFAREPTKDHYSHTMDCIAYIASRLFARPANAEDEEEEMVPQGFTGAASGAHRGGYR